MKALVNKAGLPLEVDDDAVGAGIKDPGKVRWTRRAAPLSALVMHDSLWMHHNACDSLIGSCCVGSRLSVTLRAHAFGVPVHT